MEQLGYSQQINIHPWNYEMYVNVDKANVIFHQMKDVVAPYKLLIFSDTAMFARPFLQNMDKHACNIIIYLTNRFNYGIRLVYGSNEADEAYYDLYKASSENPRVSFIADNRYDQQYASSFGIKFWFCDLVRLIPKLPDNNIIMPTKNKFFIYNRANLIWRYESRLRDLAIDFDIYGNDFQPYKDKEQICDYIGILHLPYQENIQSLAENLCYNIIYFIPTSKFLLELIDTHAWYVWEERYTCKSRESLELSVNMAEWYQPDMAGLFEYFDTWDELAEKFKKYNKFTASQLSYHPDYIAKKSAIYTYKNLNNKVNLGKWVSLLQSTYKKRPTVIFYIGRKIDPELESLLIVNSPAIIVFNNESNTSIHVEIMGKREKYDIWTKYYTVNQINIDFIKQMALDNTFNSDHFMFINMDSLDSLDHVGGGIFEICEIIENSEIPDKIKIFANIENSNPIDFNEPKSLMSGSWEALKTQRDPTPKDLLKYYGVKGDILANYKTPRNSINLILNYSNKLLDSNDTVGTYKILQYLEPYFRDETIGGRDSPYVNQYLFQHIITDYYNNNKLLLDYVIELINYKLDGTGVSVGIDKKTLDLLNYNRSNLNFYTNRNLLKFQ